MKSKLLLTLWLMGGVLYAGSTIFLAQAVLGGAGASGKQTALAVTTETQCAKEDVAGKDAETETASVEPAKPAPAPAQPKKSAADASRSMAPQPSATDGPDSDKAQDEQAQGEDSQGDAPSYAVQEPGQPGDDSASLDDWQGREAPLPGRGEDGPETEEWASVVAGTADMRSEPDLRSPMIYALPSGWHVRVISRQPGWVQVQDAHSGAAGWVESTALAPSNGPSGRAGYGGYRPGYGDPYGPPPRYADEGPYPWQGPRRRVGEFGDFLRRALGGF